MGNGAKQLITINRRRVATAGAFGFIMILTIDLETHKITPQNLTPRVVAAAWKFEGRPTKIEARPFTLIDTIRAHWSENPQNILVGQNIPFDLGCLCAEQGDFVVDVFRAYENGQILDTRVGDMLIGIAAGDSDKRRSNLGALSKRFLGVEMAGKFGEDIWRLRFDELDGLPLDEWPPEAVGYAKTDVETTEDIFLKMQMMHVKNWPEQCAAAWSLHLISVYGMRINQNRAAEWLATVDVDVKKGEALAKNLGILRANGTRDLKKLRAHVSKAYDDKPPLTDKGGVKTDADTLKNSGDDVLIAYANSRFADKLATTYAPILRGPQTVHPYYNVLVKSGRTSCRKPNMQNPPRVGGFREVFEPRPGYVFALCDYDQIELVALGQIHLWLFKTSAIADAVNEGRDLHCEVAAKLKNIHYNAFKSSYEIGYPWAKDLRQFSKVANYGFPGGLSAGVFKEYAKGFGLDVSDDEAREIRKAWLETWPEMSKYFDMIGDATRWGGCDVEQFLTGRVRGACSFTQYANTLFQGLVADGAKSALLAVSRACYAQPESVLFGSRPVAFLHDEIIIETPRFKAAEAAEKLSRIMVAQMRRFIPDVKVGAEAYLSEIWSKDARRVVKPDGSLGIWAP